MPQWHGVVPAEMVGRRRVSVVSVLGRVSTLQVLLSAAGDDGPVAWVV